MLNKLQPLSRYKGNRGKKKKENFDPDARVLALSNSHKIQLCDTLHLFR